MVFAEFPANEESRVAALYALKLMDTLPEERFERLSRMAIKALRVPISYVALIDGERQWFKSICGLPLSETERRTSLCSHTLLTLDGIICPDTHEEPRFADNPYVLGPPHVRFYLGCPLRTPDGFAVGTFCAMGYEPREFSEEDIATFRDLAAMAESELNLVDVLTLQQELQVNKAQLLERNTYIKGVLGRFVTEQVADTLLNCPQGLRLGGDKRDLTILMSDLRDFTSLSERLPAEEMVELINRYLAKMITVIERHQGTIDEFIGDAILVLFGAPVARDDHACHGVACALEMHLALEELNLDLAAEGKTQLQMGIAVHSGLAVVGNIGSDRRMKYGVVGSAVNLTARIQGFTLAGQLLVSAATYRSIADIARIDGHLRVKMKGYDQPVSIYDVGGLAGDFQMQLSRSEHLSPLAALPL